MTRLLTTPITKNNYKWLLTQPLFIRRLKPRIVRWTDLTVPVADADILDARSAQ